MSASAAFGRGPQYPDAEGGGHAPVSHPFALNAARGGPAFASGPSTVPAFGMAASYPSPAPVDTYGFMPASTSATIGAAPGVVDGMMSSSNFTPLQTPVLGPGDGPLSYDDDIYDKASLLQELSIDFNHIGLKVASVMMPFRSIEDTIMVDSDLAGPIVLCCALGFTLLLTGKMHFGYIYGFGAAGCVGMYTLLNLMSEARGMDMSRTFSVLGYCLMPILMLAAVAVVVSLKGLLGAVLGIAAVAWCTLAATRIFEVAMHLQASRWLIAYPTLLFYACFALITVF